MKNNIFNRTYHWTTKKGIIYDTQEEISELYENTFKLIKNEPKSIVYA